MRTKFERPRYPSEEEATFIKIMEKYHEATIDGLCQIVFGQAHTPALERTLRKYRERYHNFLYIDNAPKGRIIKKRMKRGNNIYCLVRENDEERRKIHLSIELDKVCACIESENTRKIWGELQHDGQLHFDNIDKLIEYRDWLESELDE